MQCAYLIIYIRYSGEARSGKLGHFMRFRLDGWRLFRYRWSMDASKEEAWQDRISPQDLLKANTLLLERRYPEAVELLQTLVAEDPTDSAALSSLGVAFTESGEHEKAIRALSRALALDERNPEAHEALGCALFRLNRLPEAKVELERARTLDPRSGGILRNLGVIYDKLGDFEGGKRLIEQACALNERDYQAVYAMASIRLREGEIEMAMELLRRIADEESPMDIRFLAMDHVRNLERYLRNGGSGAP